MYDINTKIFKKNKIKHYVVIFILIYALYLFSFAITSGFIRLFSLNSSIMSINVEQKKHYDMNNMSYYVPVYYYIVNGKEFSCESSSSMDTDDMKNKKIYYN